MKSRCSMSLVGHKVEKRRGVTPKLDKDMKLMNATSAVNPVCRRKEVMEWLAKSICTIAPQRNRELRQELVHLLLKVKIPAALRMR